MENTITGQYLTNVIGRVTLKTIFREANLRSNSGFTRMMLACTVNITSIVSIAKKNCQSDILDVQKI